MGIEEAAQKQAYAKRDAGSNKTTAEYDHQNVMGLAADKACYDPCAKACYDPCAKPLGILGRISSRRREARKANEDLYKLDELHQLLQRNPEVARILELMEQVGR